MKFFSITKNINISKNIAYLICLFLFFVGPKYVYAIIPGTADTLNSPGVTLTGSTPSTSQLQTTLGLGNISLPAPTQTQTVNPVNNGIIGVSTNATQAAKTSVNTGDASVNVSPSKLTTPTPGVTVTSTSSSSLLNPNLNPDRGNTNSEPACGTNPVVDSGWFSCLLARAVYWILKVLSFFVGIAGMFLDKVVNLTIINLGGDNGTFNKIKKPVEDTWKILRDLINITFIFGLLFISIKTILRTAGTETKKLVSTIVISAILVNFSLFFTQVIIDFSNNVTVTIYNQINQNGGNIGSSFFSQMHLEHLYNGDLALGSIIVSGIFGSVLILICAFIFFTISILLIIRFIVFIILMITSPIAIAGGVFPQIKNTVGNDWWKNLTDQCMFAPVFFLMLWIVFKLLDGLNVVVPNPTTPTSGISNSSTYDWAALLVRFVIIISLLVQALIISKKFSASGAGALQSGMLKYSGADWLKNKSAGFVARNTIGRGASRLAESGRVKGFLAKSSIGMGVYQGLQKTSKAGFGDSKGFAQREAEAIKRKEKLAEDIGSASTWEKASVTQQNIKVDKEKAKEKESTEKSNEMQNHLAASDAIDSYATNKSNLEKKQQEAERDLKEAQDYLNKPETQANPEHKAAAEKVVKKQEENVAGTKKEMANLNDAIIKAFENANIKIDPEDATSTDAAKDALEKKRREMVDMDKTGKLTAASSMKEVAEVYKKAAEAQTKAVESEKGELKKIENKLDQQTKDRQKTYASTLAKRSIMSLGLKSRSSKVAAETVRKEASKDKATTDAERNNKKELEKLAKALKEMNNEPPKTTTPTTKPTPPSASSSPKI